MESQHFANRAGWSIFLYGMFLSFISAFTPFFEAGYLFKANILLTGVLPYLIYAIAVPLLPGSQTTAAGLLLAAVHTSLVVAVRLFGITESLMITLPVIMTLPLLPLVIIALAKTDAHKDTHKPVRRIIGHHN